MFEQRKVRPVISHNRRGLGESKPGSPKHSRKGFHADPTPIRWLHPALRRRDRRSGSVPPGPLPAMRGPTSSDQSWLLPPHPSKSDGTSLVFLLNVWASCGGGTQRKVA